MKMIRIRSKALALLGALVAFFGIALAGAGTAHADAFMDPPRVDRSWETAANARFERKCTFGSSGYLLLRAKMNLQFPVGDPRGPFPYNGSGDVLGLQMFNFYTAAPVLKITYQRLEDSEASYNGNSAVFSIGNGQKTIADWFGSSYPVNAGTWNHPGSDNRFMVHEPAYIVNFQIPQVSGSTNYTCTLWMNQTYEVG